MNLWGNKYTWRKKLALTFPEKQNTISMKQKHDAILNNWCSEVKKQTVENSREEIKSQKKV